MIALAYLFCVVAPAIALAAGDTSAHCLANELPMPAATPAPYATGTGHMHADHAMHDHPGMHVRHQAAQDAPAGHHHDGKGTPAPCCAMMCVTALPANLPGLVKPLQPISACGPEIAVSVHSETPPLLYRPPIA